MHTIINQPDIDAYDQMLKSSTTYLTYSLPELILRRTSDFLFSDWLIYTMSVFNGSQLAKMKKSIPDMSLP